MAPVRLALYDESLRDIRTLQKFAAVCRWASVYLPTLLVQVIVWKVESGVPKVLAYRRPLAGEPRTHHTPAFISCLIA
jgi:hypothetical protein